MIYFIYPMISFLFPTNAEEHPYLFLMLLGSFMVILFAYQFYQGIQETEKFQRQLDDASNFLHFDPMHNAVSRRGIELIILPAKSNCFLFDDSIHSIYTLLNKLKNVEDGIDDNKVLLINRLTSTLVDIWNRYLTIENVDLYEIDNQLMEYFLYCEQNFEWILNDFEKHQANEIRFLIEKEYSNRFLELQK